MCDATGLSLRLACRLTGLFPSTCRYETQRPAADTHLSGRITELALERRRFGYWRIWQLLCREGLADERLPLVRPDTPNLTWPMDFVMDALASGRRNKCLTRLDGFIKEYLTISAAFGISGVQVISILESIMLFRGYPVTIITDQGPEFICRALE